jgi:chromosome segregation ATPase
MSESTTEKTAEQLQEELDKVLKELRRVQDDIKSVRKEKETLEAEKTTLTERVTALESDDSISRYKQMAVKAKAQLALEQQGVKNIDRVLKYVTLDDIELDDDGNLVNFDESVSGVKADLPELFDKKRGVESADIFADNPVEEQRSTTQQQVDAIFS